MLEQNFMSSMIKSSGSFIGFLDRPIAGTLGVLTMLLWAAMVWKALPFGRRQPVAA
jgi:TctA family transporter